MRKNLNNFILNLVSKKRAVYTILIIFFLSIFDALGVFALLPILNDEASKGIISDFLVSFSSYIDIENFQVYFAIFIVIISGTSRIYLHYFVVYETENYRRLLSTKLIDRLGGAYLDSLRSFQKDEISKIIITDADNVMNYQLRPLLTIIAYGTTSLLILSFLLYENFHLALIISLTLSLIYLIMFKFSKRKFSELGKLQSDLNNTRYQIIDNLYDKMEKIASIDQAKTITNYYDKTGTKLVKVNSQNTFLATLPKNILEMILIGGLLIVVLFIESSKVTFYMSTIAIFALGGLKLLPLMQGIFQALANFKFGDESYSKIMQLMSISQRNAVHAETKEIINPYLFFEIQNIKFNNKVLIKKQRLKLNLGNSYLLTGESGSGKTTLLRSISRLDRYNNINVIDDIGNVVFPKIIFQSNKNSLFPGSIIENINWFSDIKFNYEDTSEILKKTGFNSPWISNTLQKKHINFNKISAGQIQRIDTLQTLQASVHIYLFDEPFSNLDSLNSLLLYNVIVDKVKKNNSISIIISHNEEIINAHKNNKILNINDGRIEC